MSMENNTEKNVPISSRNYDLALIFIKDAKFDKALPLLESEAKKGNSKAMFKLGNIIEKSYDDSNDFEIALYWYKKACEQKNEDSLKKMGDIYFEGTFLLKDYKKALEYYLKLEKMSDEIIYRVANIFYEDGNFNEAKNYYERFKNFKDNDLNEDVYEFYLKYGISVMKVNETEKAIEIFNNFKYCDNNKYTLNLLTEIYKHSQFLKDKGELEESVNLFKWILMFSRIDLNDNEEMDIYYVEISDENRIKFKTEEEMAIEKLKKKIGSDLIILSENFIKNEEYKGAENIIELIIKSNFIELYERTSEILYTLGKSYKKIFDLDNAIDCFDKAKGLTENTEIRNNINIQNFIIGDILDKKGLFDDALSVFTKIEGTKEGEANFRVGRILYNKFFWRKAYYHFSKAVKLGNGDAGYLLGHMYENGVGIRQDKKKALEVYRKSSEAGNNKSTEKLEILLKKKFSAKLVKFLAAAILVILPLFTFVITVDDIFFKIANFADESNKDLTAEKYYNIALKLGNNKSKQSLTDLYKKIALKKLNEEEFEIAIEYYTKAIKSGEIELTNTKNELEKFVNIKKESEAGKQEYMKKLSEYYLNGKFVNKDIDRAYSLTKNSNISSKDKKYIKLLTYLEDKKVKDKFMKTYSKRRNLYDQFSNFSTMIKYKNINFDIYRKMGIEYKNSGDLVQAEKWFKKAVVLGDEFSNRQLGNLYFSKSKLYLDKNDFINAIIYLKKASNKKSSKANKQLYKIDSIVYNKTIKEIQKKHVAEDFVEIIKEINDLLEINTKYFTFNDNYVDNLNFLEKYYSDKLKKENSKIFVSKIESNYKNNEETFEKILFENQYNERIEFKKLLLSKDILEYERFVKKYPNTVYKNKITDLIKSSSIEDYEKYLRLIKNGKFVSLVKKKVEDFYYKNASDKNSIKDYEKYLNKFPQGKYVEKVKKSLDELYKKKSIEKFLNSEA